jgi:hypothetical protein
MFEPAEDLPTPTRKRVIEYAPIEDKPDPDKTFVEPPVPPVYIYSTWTDELNDIVQRACAPMLTLLGAIAGKLRIDDVRTLMVYNENVKDPYSKLAIVQGKTATSVEAWARENAFLGPKLIGLYLQSVTTEQWKKTSVSPMKVNACLDIRVLDRNDIPDHHDVIRATPARVDAAQQVVDNRQRAFDANPTNETRAALDQAVETLNLIRTQLVIQDGVNRVRELLEGHQEEMTFAPAWAFGVMPEAAFTRFISPPAWAAIQAGVGWIRRLPRCGNYTLKELVCSESILDHFATVIAYHFLNLGDGTGITSGGGNLKRARTYLNVNKMRDDLLLRMHLIATWFQMSVFTRTHPLLKKFDERIAMLDPADRAPLEIYRQHLPMRMLVAHNY